MTGDRHASIDIASSPQKKEVGGGAFRVYWCLSEHEMSTLRIFYMQDAGNKALNFGGVA